MAVSERVADESALSVDDVVGCHRACGLAEREDAISDEGNGIGDGVISGAGNLPTGPDDGVLDAGDLSWAGRAHSAPIVSSTCRWLS